MPKNVRREKAVEIMKKLGLEKRIDFKVAHLSGGEQQRVAIARALMTDPQIIFADEPTASVDEQTAYAIIDLFKTLKDQGKTVIVSTHDNSLIKEATLHLKISNGKVT
jgi:ABC-type lipoprotein export system ATPase subunit